MFKIFELITLVATERANWRSLYLKTTLHQTWGKSNNWQSLWWEHLEQFILVYVKHILNKNIMTKSAKNESCSEIPTF